MLKKSIVPIVLLGLIISFVTFPSICIEAAREGLLLWFHKVLPSLLPFMIVINIFVNLQTVKNASNIFSPLTNKLWKLPGVSLLVFILSLLAGYPMGARIIKELLTSGELTKPQCEKTLCFCNNCGLIFIIATVGITLFNNITIGYFLLIIHILSAFIVSIICRPITTSSSLENSVCINISHTPVSKKNFVSLFNESVTLSVDTITCVGGYIIFFSVISSLITKTPLFTNILSTYSNPNRLLLSGYISGILELSSGVNTLSSLNTLYCLPLISFVLAFGGICVYCQTLYIIGKNDFFMLPYLLSKITQAIISFILTIILSPYLFSICKVDFAYHSNLLWIIIFILVLICSRILILNISKRYSQKNIVSNQYSRT